MVHIENNNCGTPLDQVQDASRQEKVVVVDDDTQSVASTASTEVAAAADNTTTTITTENVKPSTKTSGTVTWAQSVSSNNDVPSSTAAAAEKTNANAVRPEMSRATSYGAAAPYVAAPLTNILSNVSFASSLRPMSMFSGKGDEEEQNEKQLTNLSRVSTDAQGFTYPEGGAQAWLCVFGSFCGMMSALGIMNTIGPIHTYLATHQLETYSESTIGWIFSIYTFLAFFCGIQIGPLFDATGPKWLVGPGSILILITWFTIGLCTQYWHFVLVFGVCGGVGTSLVFTPCVTAIGHFFLRKRGLCTGIAAAGGSMGGVVYPLVLQALFPKVGFAWATRVIGFISIALVIIANLFIKARLPPQAKTANTTSFVRSVMPDLTIFRDPIYSLTTAGIFFVEWALFVPLTYLTSYSIAHGLDENLSYQIIAFLSVGSCFGRWLPGFLADKFGRFNTMVVTIAICLVTTFAIWLPAGNSVPAIIVYAVIFGFASGSGISLTPVCVSQLCKVENYGRYYATCYTMVSFACLTGVPIAGSLISAAGGAYWGVIVFTGCAYTAAVACFVAARVLGVGWALRKVF